MSHIHLVNNSPTTTERYKNGMHMHLFNGAESTLSESSAPNHTHVINGVVTSYPVNADTVTVKTDEKTGKVEMEIGGNIHQLSSEHDAIKKLKELGLMSDVDIAICEQFETSPLIKFA